MGYNLKIISKGIFIKVKISKGKNMNDTKDYFRVSAGLGEEVLADAKEEKLIEKLSNSIKSMVENNLDYDEMARKVVKLSKKHLRGK